MTGFSFLKEKYIYSEMVDFGESDKMIINGKMDNSDTYKEFNYEIKSLSKDLLSPAFCLFP